MRGLSPGRGRHRVVVVPPWKRNKSKQLDGSSRDADQANGCNELLKKSGPQLTEQDRDRR